MEILYELNCENCGAEYEILFSEEAETQPQYCPFCGSDIDLSDVDEEQFDEDLEELDFDDDRL